jgi:ActR/RegA family two-component response regulator
MSKYDKPMLIALDDDVAVLRQISHVAGGWYTVFRTHDPRVALHEAETNPAVQVVVTEQVLRIGDGISVLENLRTRRPDIRRVLLTGYNEIPSLIAGLHSGAIQSMLQKPIRERDLQQTLAPTPASRGLKASA